MLLFDSLRPSEIVRSISASLFGVATVGFGVTHDNIWAAIIGSRPRGWIGDLDIRNLVEE